MLLRGMMAAGIVAVGAVVSAHGVLDFTVAGFLDPARPGDRPTLAKAPLSLGNPAAAATLRTRGPSMPHEARRRDTEPYALVIQPEPGDTLTELFVEHGVPSRDAYKALAAMGEVFDARRVRAGQDIHMAFRSAEDGNSKGEFLGFYLHPEYNREIKVWRDDDGDFEAFDGERSLDRELVRRSNKIDSSLYLAGADAGLPAAVLVEMIRIYSWDVDFQRDIRPGDHFEVMYERFYNGKGQPVHEGKIVYAKLTLSGEGYPMYLYETAEGDEEYFDEQGQAARKALLRTPINGARLSSGFGRRRHPVLGYTKMHTGIDFAAPRGTPIYAGGDGTIDYAGRKGGYGNYIRIRHNGRYATAYAHMKRFAKGMGKGRRVKQGQVIGYVGSTGRSTGPHLHYEILVDGGHVNPLKIKMPSGRKLKGAELERFAAAKQALDTRFAALAPAKVVASSEEDGAVAAR